MKSTTLYAIFCFVLATLFVASNAMAYTCPNYLFSTDLKQGSKSPDVRVMQEILDLDKRTLVSYTGPGSPGKETTYFGVATREALKRFQALFIEYIGIANGKFGPRTRTTMNAVCKGPFFTGGGGNVYDLSGTTSSDVTPPIIAIAGPSSTDIMVPFRAYLGSNEPLKDPTLQGLIISNGTAGDLRKTASTTYSFLVTPNQDADGPISLQFEADSLSDLAGNKNENATNEWIVQLTGTSTSSTTEDITIPDIVLPVIASSTTDCSQVASVDINDYSNPCYGKVPMTDNGQQAQDQQAQDQMMMQMLQSLLQGLMGALKGGGSAGGDCTCACTGAPTTFLTPFGGNVAPGAYNMIANPRTGANWTGSVLPASGICGQKMVNGKCVNPQLNACGQPYTGIIPAGPFWSN